MIPALIGLPGKIKTVLDRLTATRAGLLDNLNATITSRAPAAGALSDTVWTSARADMLDNVAQDAAPVANAVTHRQCSGGSAGSLSGFSGLGLTIATATNQAALSDVLNYTGAGVLLFVGAHNGSTGPASPQIIVTVDGVDIYASALTGVYTGFSIVGCFNSVQAMVAFDAIPFKSSLRIQHKSGASGSINTGYVFRKTA